MRNFFYGVLVLCCSTIYAQDNGRFFGGLESYSQWLQPDKGLSFKAPNERFRANNYMAFNYSQNGFTAGVQYESYLPTAMLGHAPSYGGNNGVTNYYINYKNEKLDVTGGYFYEQFGSGLVFRSWEDKRLGLNNALKGINIKLKPTDFLNLKAVFGKQRNGFEESLGTIQGLDAKVDVSSAFSFGGSYIARYQNRGTNDSIPNTVGVYGGRFDFNLGGFYGGAEAALKDPDVIANEGKITSNKLYDGTALQANLGFTAKGIGINTTFRRLENYSFFSDRLAEGNIYNQQVMNFVPALTKQQDYLLTNIYVYNPQPRLIIEKSEQRYGEVGGQADIFFSFKKGSALGGKYGTKFAANFSYWEGLGAADYYVPNRWYKTKFAGGGPKLFRDINAEMKKRWAKKFSTVLTYQNVIVDKGVVQGSPLGKKTFHANIGVIEATTKFNKGKSFRIVGQHLWTKQDRKNWAAGVLEYNFSPKFLIYAVDSYNYGGKDKIHYYLFGAGYSKGNTSLRVNYGRQRGGLICVGGVCRFVPESTGFNTELNIIF